MHYGEHTPNLCWGVLFVMSGFDGMSIMNCEYFFKLTTVGSTSVRYTGSSVVRAFWTK